MGDPVCQLPTGWDLLGAAPAYSAFAGILSGFLFLGIVTLLTERSNSYSADNEGQAGIETAGERASARSQPAKKAVNRSRALMLFLPAFLNLVGSSFTFGLVSGEQVCARGSVEGIFASSLLGVGALGVFNGISWMLDAYGESNEDLRRVSIVITYIWYFAVVGALEIFSVYIIDDAFDNRPPSYALVALIVYGPLLMISVTATRIWFMPDESGWNRAQFAAVYLPAAYAVIVLIIDSLLNSYHPAEWQSLDDWKTYLALSVALFFPAATVIAYARFLPGGRHEKIGAWRRRIHHAAVSEGEQSTTTR